MKSISASTKIIYFLVLVFVFAIVFLPGWVRADWLKIDPPPDVDKTTMHPNLCPGPNCPPTCWLMTAANILAGAGYGLGATVQARAENIYTDLYYDPCTPWGTPCTTGGWVKTAIEWWLDSDRNFQKGTNEYRIVRRYAHSDPTKPNYPWDDPNGAQFIGNVLRHCCGFVGLHILDPDMTPHDPDYRGHAITAWGDSGGANLLTTNPAQVKVTDSDRDGGGFSGSNPDVQTYTYDDYWNPPDPNLGPGWYIDYYDPNHIVPGNRPYIGPVDILSNNHIFWGLTPLAIAPPPGLDEPIACSYVDSYSVVHFNYTNNAIGLKYDVSSSGNEYISAYGVRIDWPIGLPPDINDSDPRTIKVSWDLSANPVPPAIYPPVTITTELVLLMDPMGPFPFSGSPIRYSNVCWVFPLGVTSPLPSFACSMPTPEVPDTNIPDICGGYVVGSFDFFDDPGGTVHLGEYRFLRQYRYYQDPELHEITLEALEGRDCFVGNFRFGHSYGFLDDNSLWDFEQWMTEEPDTQQFDPDDVIAIPLNWEGQLPYPDAGEYIPPAEPNACGDLGTVFLPQDLNRDCYIDFSDFALFAMRWVVCTDPNNPDCDIYWK